MRGGKLAGNTDAAPVDDFGGFRENWTVYYAGRKARTLASSKDRLTQDRQISEEADALERRAELTTTSHRFANPS